MPLSTRAYLSKLNREVNRIQDAISPVEYKRVTDYENGHFDNGLYENATNMAWQATEFTSSILPFSIGSTETVTTRAGDIVKLQNLTIRGTINYTTDQYAEIYSTSSSMAAASTVQNQSTCRLVIFSAKHSDPSMNFTTYDNAGNFIPFFRENGNTQALTEGPFNPKGDEVRFQTNILYDKTIIVDPYHPSYHFDFVLPLNFMTTYDHESTGAVTNGLYYIIISDGDAGASGTTLTSKCPYFRFVWRLSFTDV